MYDAIVAGAGPAGSAAAMALAELGGRVLLADRCALPRYKSCSGMLIRKTLVLAERYFGRALPAEVSCAPAENRGMVFTDSQGREYRFEQTGLNVWRSGCDYFWAKRAEERGAELRDKTPVLACREEGDGIAVSLGGAGPVSDRLRGGDGLPAAASDRGGAGLCDYIPDLQPGDRRVGPPLFLRLSPAGAQRL